MTPRKPDVQRRDFFGLDTYTENATMLKASGDAPKKKGGGFAGQVKGREVLSEPFNTPI